MQQQPVAGAVGRPPSEQPLVTSEETETCGTNEKGASSLNTEFSATGSMSNISVSTLDIGK